MPFQVDEDIDEPFGSPDSWGIQADGLSSDEAYALVKKISLAIMIPMYIGKWLKNIRCMKCLKRL